ncbi:protein DpdH [Thermopolyspora sp. NPDC052614]|uniref:protein DpdH n=1 Tax=Thermopolyspora sp. NPDC052614 TaxID=3155682 RepID=UPI00343FA8F7
MSEFAGHLCWDKVEAGNVISTEAVSPSRAVFFATHAPLRISRRASDNVDQEYGGEVVGEEDVRRDFLGRTMANGVLLMPVVGGSGSGKSHLVRWVKECTESTPQRHVIYLEKARTSLKSIVDALLAEVEGSQFDQLRSDVLRMGAEITLAGLKQRLLNYLQEALTEAEARSGPERLLVGPGKLELILLDPVLREHMLQEGRLIPRLAEHLWADRGAGNPERQLSFTEDDLPLNLLNIDDAAVATKRLCTLIQTRPDLQKAALDLLNRHLDVAVMNATNMGVGRLQNAMIDIRKEFARRRQEIVLLIEDFALIQGIQRDLLESIIEVGVRDGSEVLAPIRTLLAITPGPYRDLVDTVTTRIKATTPYAYYLEQQFDGGPDAIADAASFVGRYLNAARVGVQGLEGRADPTNAVPNRCDDCRFREQCHAGFGVSREGHGLYPFNEKALERLIRSRARLDSSGNLLFNPRSVVGEVVRNVLVEHADAIRSGAFPEPRFREEYPAGANGKRMLAAVREELTELDPTDADRRITFVEFWGGAPDRPVNLHPSLHDAFRIRRLEDLETTDQTSPRRKQQDKRPDPDRTQDPAPRPDEKMPASLVKFMNDIERWANGGAELSQGTARELRSVISQAVVRRAQWLDPLAPEPSSELMKKVWPNRSTIVSIEGAVGEALNVSNAAIRFTRSDRNAVFFQGILKARAGIIEGNVAHIRRLNEIAETNRKRLQDAICAAREANENHLATAVRVALFGAALAGRALPGMSLTGLLNASLDPGHGWVRHDQDIRTTAWRNAWDQHRRGRPQLVAGIREAIGVAQGRGAVTMLDTARILPYLHDAADSWAWDVQEDDVPEWAKTAAKGLADWNLLLEEQAAALHELLQGIRALLPKGARGRETVESVKAALESAVKVGIKVPDDLRSVREMNERALNCEWSVVHRLEQDLDRLNQTSVDDQTRQRKLVVAAATDRSEHLQFSMDFLSDSHTWLSASLEEARMRESNSGEGALRELDRLLERWATAAGVDMP